jgi:Flp pilus assembly protein TadD
MSNENRCVNTIVTLSLAGLLSLAGAVGCEKSQPVEEVKKEAPPAAASSGPMEEKAEMPAAGTATALMAPEGSAGRAANDEGVSHAQQGHWDVAEGHFRKAIEADPKLAEAQYNLGLALDKLDKHDEAKAAFQKAAELAPANTEITESPILKKHIGA